MTESAIDLKAIERRAAPLEMMVRAADEEVWCFLTEGQADAIEADIADLVAEVRTLRDDVTSLEELVAEARLRGF